MLLRFYIIVQNCRVLFSVFGFLSLQFTQSTYSFIDTYEYKYLTTKNNSSSCAAQPNLDPCEHTCDSQNLEFGSRRCVQEFSFVISIAALTLVIFSLDNYNSHENSRIHYVPRVRQLSECANIVCHSILNFGG